MTAEIVLPLSGVGPFGVLLDRLAAGGMRRCILATGYLSETIERSIGARWNGMEIAYSVEPEPLGTGGAIRVAASAPGREGLRPLVDLE